MKTATALLAAVAATFGFSLPIASTTVPVQSTRCVTITRTLTLGSSGKEVQDLQKFLGVKATGFFGPLTQSATIKWQIDNHVITSSKTPGAGTTGPKTRTAMRCNQMATSTPATAQTSAFPDPSIQSFSSVPIPAEPPPVAPAPQVSGGGGYSAPQCPAFTVPKPSDSQCQWQWQIIPNEAGCPAEWDCSDPNATY